jgi:hypothetical protein
MQTFLKPFKKLAGRVLLGLKPLALRARGFKPNTTLLSPARFLNSTYQRVFLLNFYNNVLTPSYTFLAIKYGVGLVRSPIQRIRFFSGK